jgi:hypothetical protein
VGHSSQVVLLSPEQVGGLVLCLGLYGILSLFCQNMLDDVLLYDWMLQKAPFADGPHSRGSLYLYSFIIIIIIILIT